MFASESVMLLILFRTCDSGSRFGDESHESGYVLVSPKSKPLVCSFCFKVPFWVVLTGVERGATRFLLRSPALRPAPWYVLPRAHGVSPEAGALAGAAAQRRRQRRLGCARLKIPAFFRVFLGKTWFSTVHTSFFRRRHDTLKKEAIWSWGDGQKGYGQPHRANLSDYFLLLLLHSSTKSTRPSFINPSRPDGFPWLIPGQR